jgi:hypothetical protein
MTIVLISEGSRRIETAGTGYDAIMAAIRRAEAEGLHPMRIGADDWVTAGDIAARVGRCRETVRLWATGQLGSGDFPPPLNPGNETTFYSWTEVVPWLQRRGHDLPHGEPVLTAMNLALQLRHLAPQLTRLDSVLDCVIEKAIAGPTRS